MSDFPPGAHDAYLANYHRGMTQVWCANKVCPNHEDGLEIDTETEYGQTVYVPEECPICHSEWLDEKPDDDYDEEASMAAHDAGAITQVEIEEGVEDPREWKGEGQ